MSTTHTHTHTHTCIHGPFCGGRRGRHMERREACRLMLPEVRRTMHVGHLVDAKPSVSSLRERARARTWTHTRISARVCASCVTRTRLACACVCARARMHACGWAHADDTLETCSASSRSIFPEPAFPPCPCTACTPPGRAHTVTAPAERARRALPAGAIMHLVARRATAQSDL
jgi:hypothetical protein